MYEDDFALNNLRGLICHKIQTNKQSTTAFNTKFKYLYMFGFI